MLLVNKDLQTVKGHGYRRAGAHHVGRTRRLHCVYIQAGYYCINVYCLTQTIYSVNDALCYGAHSILVIMTSSHHWAVFSFAFCPSVRLLRFNSRTRYERRAGVDSKFQIPTV